MDVPLVLVPTKYPTLKEKDITELGKVKMVIYANHGLRASIRNMEATFKKIKKDGGIYDIDDFVAPMSTVFDLQGIPALKANEKKFLR